MQEFESCEIYIAILLLGFAANDLKKNTIRDGGSTALYTSYTVYTVYTIQTAVHCMYACIYCYIVRGGLKNTIGMS